ncbi:MAG: type VI secretion system membrane subunit TssM [Sphingomonadales bacterium]
MTQIRKILGNWWVVAVAAALLASLVLFLVCGLFVAALLPLRWWLIGLVWLVFAGLAGWRWFRQRKADAALTEAIVKPADIEGEAMAAKMKAALDQVKGQGKGSLYAKPWYVIIGPPGAGKTTLIQKSGLRLLTDEATAGVGGTRNCDWWFTDEAVLIDTAGRYTSQDSSASQDAQGWKKFLGTLKKARPLQPLNGVIVAIGLDELGKANAEALERHIVTLRARIAELSKELGLELPVYVLFTKADLLVGFTEFFDDLSVEGRRAVVGHTLPLVADKPSQASLAAGYDNAVQALADRLPNRLQSEGDPVRRGAAFTLPARFIDLRARLIRLLDGVFGAGASATPGAAQARLRGFYFTSGVQQGTPFDRLLGSLSASIGQGQRARPSNPRAFFVNRLLADVIIPEAGLAGPDMARRKRNRALQLAMAAGGTVVALGFVVALIVSFLGNRSGQDATLASADQIKAAQAALDPGDRVALSASLAEPLDLLDALRDRLPYGVTPASHPPLSQRFGLYRTDLADESSRAYHDALQRYLLPRLIIAAESALRAAGDDPVAVYEPLKIYLMLGNRAGARRDGSYILQWLEQDLAAREFPGEENAPTRARILAHARALLADDGSFGRQLTGALLDGPLVQATQGIVAAMSPEQRALALLKQTVSGEPWRMVGNALLPGEAKAFANPAELEALTVPYLFTKAGFQKGFAANLAGIRDALDRDRWMLGNSPAAQVPLNMSQLGALYADEYARRWQAVLKAPQPGDYASDTTALARLANKGSSPLKKISDQVVANVSGLMPNVAAPALPGGALGQAAGAALAADAGQGAANVAARQIQATFQGLKDYAGGPAPQLGQLLDALGRYQLALAQAKVDAGGAGGGGGGGAAGIAAAAAELQVAAQNAGAGAPELGNFVAQVASGSSNAAETQRTSEIRAAYTQTVAADCARVFGAGYPFGTGADLAPADVSRVSAQMSGFARDTLGPLLDRSNAKSGWRWIAEPTVKSFRATSAKQFQRAADVEALMGGNLVLRVSAVPGIKGGVRLRTGGVPMDLMPGGAPERFGWSTAGSQIAELGPLQGGTAPALREEGPWSLFRLLAKGRKQMLGAGRYRFFFGADAAIDVEVAAGPDPFAADGVFALRCPVAL